MISKGIKSKNEDLAMLEVVIDDLMLQIDTLIFERNYKEAKSLISVLESKLKWYTIITGSHHYNAYESKSQKTNSEKHSTIRF